MSLVRQDWLSGVALDLLQCRDPAVEEVAVQRCSKHRKRIRRHSHGTTYARRYDGISAYGSITPGAIVVPVGTSSSIGTGSIGSESSISSGASGWLS